MNAIEMKEISRKYGKVQALENVSLNVGEGEICGLIGPDGAGKSTLFRIMTTLILPDSGSGNILGLDIVGEYEKIRGLIGYMPGRFSLYQDLSVAENLEFFATMFGTTVKENYNTIREIYSQLEPFAARRAGKLSGGMKQKLALCCALIHKPRILFLDEPTTGVDAVSRKEFWTMLKRIKDEGITVVVSTPYMDEAGMCDRISLIRDGHIINSGTPEEIRGEYPFRLFTVSGKNLHGMLKLLRGVKGTESCYSFGNNLHLACSPECGNMEKIGKILAGAGFGDAVLEEASPSIEDCFLAFSKNKILLEQ